MGPSGAIAEAAEIAQWISIVATTVDQTLIRRYMLSYAFPKGADGSPDRAAIEAVLPDLRNVFAVLETRLSGRDYLAAHRFTFADALLLTTLNPTLRRPEAAKISADTPAVRRYFELHSRRPSFVDTAPSAGARRYNFVHHSLIKIISPRTDECGPVCRSTGVTRP